MAILRERAGDEKIIVRKPAVRVGWGLHPSLLSVITQNPLNN